MPPPTFTDIADALPDEGQHVTARFLSREYPAVFRGGYFRAIEGGVENRLPWPADAWAPVVAGVA